MKFLFLFSVLLSGNLIAAGPSLDNLNEDDVKKISKEFSANFVHTIVAPASSYGKLFGFEVGLAAGQTDSPNINRVSKTIDSSANIAEIYHLGLIGGVSVPFGITGEISILPEIKASGMTASNTSAALKWTFSELLGWPLDLALRVHTGSSKFTYSDVVDTNVNTNMSWENSSTGYNLEVSKSFIIVEPYVGFGYVSTETDIKASAATTVNIFTFTSSQSYTSKNSGTHLYGGLNLNLLFFKLGAEYSKIMGVSRMSGKLSFYF